MVVSCLSEARVRSRRCFAATTTPARRRARSPQTLVAAASYRGLTSLLEVATPLCSVAGRHLPYSLGPRVGLPASSSASLGLGHKPGHPWSPSLSYSLLRPPILHISTLGLLFRLII
jgi:hypothetical protein